MKDSHLIARQPICNGALKVVAFELLYRMQGDQNNAIINNDDSATIDVLLAAYNDLSITDVVGTQKAFVNFTSNIIINRLPPLPPKQLVIELLEGQETTPELIKALKHLRTKGYKIALDDFCLNSETLSLIDCADIIKLDVLDQSPSEWADYIPKLKQRGITMLAEKVETYDVFEECKALGFELFQGYFFARPKILLGKKMSRNEVSVINLLSKLNNTEVDFDEVIKLISADVSLSYSLLRTVNSGMYSLPKKADSIRQAAVTLGLHNLKNWINLLALGSLDNKPKILIETAMVRAKMCELIGKNITKKDTADDYFTVGLFSMMDAFFDMPLDALINKLSLKQETIDALIKHKGTLGETLQVVIAYQEGRLDQDTAKPLHTHSINNTTITQHYLDSLIWAKKEDNK
jgi:EAL and modified HD-GYP domain-containing signal transduction protein